MEHYKDRAYSRNYGFFSEEEQKKLNQSIVSIAGVGGDGFQLGLKLLMNGILHIKVADPETFEEENSNRVLGATVDNYGKNKAEAFSEMAHKIRPDARIEVYNHGVTQDNVEEFIHGSDLLLDESELTRLEIGTNLAREARRQKVPSLIVMNLGFAALATSFKSEGGKTFEDIMGLSRDMPLDEVAEQKVDFSRCLPYIPNYGDIRTLISVQNGAPLPSISQGVDVASAIGSTEVFLHLTNGNSNHRRQPTWAPKFRYMDSYNGESGIARYPRLSYHLGITALLARSLFGKNPKASYSDHEQKERDY